INGPYFLIVKTDTGNQVLEFQHEGDNVAASAAVQVQLTPPPDLQVTQVQAPAQAFSGQSMALTWTVTNAGSGVTAESAWSDRIVMSLDGTFDSNDIVLASIPHTGSLAAGAIYTNSATVTLPIGLSGDFKFLVVTDAQFQVYEHALDGNNTG